MNILKRYRYRLSILGMFENTSDENHSVLLTGKSLIAMAVPISGPKAYTKNNSSRSSPSLPAVDASDVKGLTYAPVRWPNKKYRIM